MTDNALAPVEGSTLSPRDEPYKLPELRVPQSIDGDPYEALDESLAEYDLVLVALIGYAEKLEALTRSVMLGEGTTLPDHMLPPEGASGYPERTYELAAVAQANRALGLAGGLIDQARRELAKPIAESRRML